MLNLCIRLYGKHWPRGVHVTFSKPVYKSDVYGILNDI